MEKNNQTLIKYKSTYRTVCKGIIYTPEENLVILLNVTMVIWLNNMLVKILPYYRVTALLKYNNIDNEWTDTRHASGDG